MPYSTITLTPTIAKVAYDANDVMSTAFEEVPLPTRNGKPCKITNVTISDRSGLNKDFRVFFVENIDGATTLGTAGSAITISSANMLTNKLLSVHNAGATDMGSADASFASVMLGSVLHGNGANPYYQIQAKEAVDTSGSGANVANHITITLSVQYEIPN